MYTANDQNFQKLVLNSKGLVLVDFWAEWCGPCRHLGPIVEQIEEKLNGKFTLVKVNVDQAPETASKYGLRSIPALYLFKDGELIDSKVGLQSQPSLEEWLNNN